MSTAASSPLVLLQLPWVRALDPRSGRLMWEARISETGLNPGRFVLTPHGVFVIALNMLWLFNTMTGQLLARVQAPFNMQGGLFEDGVFYVYNSGESAAITIQGQTLWQMKVEAEGLWKNRLICRDGAGNVLWQGDPPELQSPNAAGMALGTQIAQPDDKGSR